MERADADLLRNARRDPAAFAQFYDRYERAVAGYLVRRVRDGELAADLTAEVFAAALSAAARYRPKGPTAAPWLFTIAHNTLVGSLRRGQVEARARRRLGMERIELGQESISRVEALESEAWVEDLLTRLPPDQREAVRARVLDERDYRDIARELRASELVVRKRVSRGLAALRRQMEETT